MPTKSMHEVRTAIDKTGTDIKMIQHRVQRCMDDGSKHMELKEGRYQEVDIQKGLVPLCIKIELEDLAPPLIVHLDYMNQADVQVYCSQTELEPTADNCDWTYANPRQIKIVPIN